MEDLFGPVPSPMPLELTALNLSWKVEGKKIRLRLLLVDGALKASWHRDHDSISGYGSLSEFFLLHFESISGYGSIEHAWFQTSVYCDWGVDFYQKETGESFWRAFFGVPHGSWIGAIDKARRDTEEKIQVAWEAECNWTFVHPDDADAYRLSVIYDLEYRLKVINAMPSEAPSISESQLWKKYLESVIL